MHRQHSRSLIIALGLVASLMASTACDRRTQLQVFAGAVEGAARALEEQKAETAESLSAAEQARKEALQRVQFSFTSPETQRFIDRWKQAEREVQQLRSDFNELLEKTDFFFAYAEKKMRAIRDSSLQSRSERAIAKKKSSFSAASGATHRAISELEETVARGNDLIAALEIAGVLGSVATEVENLGALQDRAIEKMPEMESLISEGKRLVEVEYSVLEAEEGNP